MDFNIPRIGELGGGFMCSKDINLDKGLQESENIVKNMLRDIKEKFDVDLKAHIFREKVLPNHIVALFEFTNGYDVLFESDIKYFLYEDGICIDLSTSEDVLQLKLI